jgi:hypothetical protein
VVDAPGGWGEVGVVEERGRRSGQLASTLIRSAMRERDDVGHSASGWSWQQTRTLRGSHAAVTILVTALAGAGVAANGQFAATLSHARSCEVSSCPRRLEGRMIDQAAAEWPTCDEPSCIGIRLAESDSCLAHASDQHRKFVLQRLHETGEIDARGVPFTTALLEQILAAALHDNDDNPTFAAARFGGVTFEGDAGFGGVTFEGDAGFREVTFEGDAGFGGATFQGDAGFYGATFQGDAGFYGATFQGDAGFYGATFQGDAGFGRATFQRGAVFRAMTFEGDAWFDRATFQRDAWFDRATFQRDVEFGGATFQGDAWFDRATFQRDVEFGGAVVRRDARFSEATFEQARQLGPLLVYGLLRLDGAYFAQLTVIEVSSRGLSCQRTRFPAGVQFRLRGAQVVLDDADLPSPSLLTGVDALSDARLARRERRLVQAVRRLAPAAAQELSARPRLLSVQGANLAGLGVAKIDLTWCRFAGAHNLDQLRFETEVSFAAAPAWLPWDWRQVLAEERAWRTTRPSRRAARWAAADSWPTWLHQPYRTQWPQGVEPAQLAGLYRALRKAREDNKDAPGAADFYYGEMEMRRHARRGRTGGASRGRVERTVLTPTGWCPGTGCAPGGRWLPWQWC